MDTNIQILKSKAQLEEFFSQINEAEFKIIYEKVLKENYSIEFVKELDLTFYANDEETEINNIYLTSLDYKKPSDRFFNEYCCNIATFIIDGIRLYIVFDIPGIEQNVYELIYEKDLEAIDQEYIKYKLTESEGLKYDNINESIIKIK